MPKSEQDNKLEILGWEDGVFGRKITSERWICFTYKKQGNLEVLSKKSGGGGVGWVRVCSRGTWGKEKERGKERGSNRVLGWKRRLQDAALRECKNLKNWLQISAVLVREFAEPTTQQLTLSHKRGALTCHLRSQSGSIFVNTKNETI